MTPKLAIAALAIALGLPALGADTAPTLADPHSLRAQAMKNAAAAAGLGGRMLKGEAPFDARVAQAVLTTLNSSALGLGLMFPDGSGGLDTEASEKIWSDPGAFDAAVTKFLADTGTAVAAKVSDMDGFKASFAAVTANCKSCHEAFRVKRD